MNKKCLMSPAKLLVALGMDTDFFFFFFPDPDAKIQMLTAPVDTEVMTADTKIELLVFFFLHNNKNNAYAYREDY